MANDTTTELARVLAEKARHWGRARVHLPPQQEKIWVWPIAKDRQREQGAAASHNDNHRKALIEILAGSGARQWPTSRLVLAGTDDPYQTPDEVALRRQRGVQLFRQGTSTAPLVSPWQAAAQAVQGGLGGYELGQARDQEARGKGAANSALIDAMTGNKSHTEIATTAVAIRGRRISGRRLPAPRSRTRCSRTRRLHRKP